MRPQCQGLGELRRRLGQAIPADDFRGGHRRFQLGHQLGTGRRPADRHRGERGQVTVLDVGVDEQRGRHRRNEVQPVDPLFLNPKARLFVPEAEGGAIDGAVDRFHQVEVAHVVRPLVAQRLATLVVLGDARAEHPRDVPVLERGGVLRRLQHLVAGEQVAQLLGVLAALVLGPGEAEQALGHHAQRVDGHDPQRDDDEAGREAHRPPHAEETEIGGLG